MSKRIDLDTPRPGRVKIVMALRAGVTPMRAAQAGIACGRTIGAPPPGASLLARSHAVVLFLPKRCLLDRKVEREATTTPQ